VEPPGLLFGSSGSPWSRTATQACAGRDSLAPLAALQAALDRARHVYLYSLCNRRRRLPAGSATPPPH
jgi:hypothetical protein